MDHQLNNQAEQHIQDHEVREIVREVRDLEYGYRVKNEILFSQSADNRWRPVSDNIAYDFGELIFYTDLIEWKVNGRNPKDQPVCPVWYKNTRFSKKTLRNRVWLIFVTLFGLPNKSFYSRNTYYKSNAK